jgi:hypothetical protein
MCLVLNALALVLNVLAEKLGCLEVWWLEVFIAPTTKMVVGEGCCRWVHQTVRCATGHCPVSQPRGSTVGALTSGATEQSGGTPDSHCSLFGAPSAPALTLHALSAYCSRTANFCRRPLALLAVAPLGTPDSLVLHRTVW